MLVRQRTTKLAALIGPFTLTSFVLPCKFMHVTALYNYYFSLFIMSSEGKTEARKRTPFISAILFNVLFIYIFGGFHSVEKSPVLIP